MYMMHRRRRHPEVNVGRQAGIQAAGPEVSKGRQTSYLQLPMQPEVLVLLILPAVLPVASAETPAAVAAVAPDAGIAHHASAVAAALLAVLHKLALEPRALLGQRLAALVADGLAKLEVL
jgi:hypothetical protein